MHHCRILTHGADSAAVEAVVLAAVGECYSYAVARLSRTDGYSSGIAIEFDCPSPALATALAEEACEIGEMDSVELTIDGRMFPVPRPAQRLDVRTSA